MARHNLAPVSLPTPSLTPTCSLYVNHIAPPPWKHLCACSWCPLGPGFLFPSLQWKNLKASFKEIQMFPPLLKMFLTPEDIMCCSSRLLKHIVHASPTVLIMLYINCIYLLESFPCMSLSSNRAQLTSHFSHSLSSSKFDSIQDSPSNFLHSPGPNK